MMRREFTFSGSRYPETAIYDYPHNCPHCGRSEKPVICLDTPITYSHYAEKETSELIEIYQCSYKDCAKYFLEVYSYFQDTGDGFDYQPIQYTYTGKHLKINFPEGISKISKDFIEISRQATEAENVGLDQLSGMGYRKALEFLIKDYLIKKNPDQVENIKKELLGKTISERLSDFPKLQVLAKAANWIGTDQVHYQQRFSTADLQSMKKYISAAETFISANYLADSAEEFINENDPKKTSDKKQ